MGETGAGKTEPSMPKGKGKPKFPEPRPRGKRDESGSKNIRPTTLQKFCKKFDGTGDPYEHVALFNQLIYAEGVTDVHTKVHGFGLTLSGSALSWFQTLKSDVLYDFDILIKKFIEAHTKIGIKHNTVTLILNFKQEERETVRQCIDRMKQYIARCPESEKPKQERLVSCFLEGLLDEDLYMLLFVQDHKDFEFCCFEAQRLDDNRKGKGRSHVDEQRLDSSSQARRNDEVVSHNIAERVARLLKQENKANQQYRAYQPTQPLRDNPQGALKWCEPCRRWGNHSTNECYSKQRYMREVGAAMPGDFKPTNVQPASNTHEAARPVLGAQPAPPGTTPFHYVQEVEDPGQSLELVPTGPCYEESHDSMQLAISQLTDLDTSVVQLPAQALYMLANGGYRSQGGYAKRSASPGVDTPIGPCYECQGPHLVRDCSVRKEKILAANAGGYQSWPRVLRYCGGCGNDHLAKDCPSKPAETKTSFGYVGVIPSPSTSETEGDVVSLRMITRNSVLSNQPEPLLTPIEGEIAQQGNRLKASKQRRRKSCKGKNKGRSLPKESSSGNDSSDTGSWESIVLETPDGTRRLYVVQTMAEIKQTEPNPKMETAPHGITTEPLRVVTRAQAKKALEKGGD